jgi:hypothetical protein
MSETKAKQQPQRVDQYGLILDFPTEEDMPRLLHILEQKRFKVRWKVPIHEYAKRSLGAVYFRKLSEFYVEKCLKWKNDKLTERAERIYDAWNEFF